MDTRLRALRRRLGVALLALGLLAAPGAVAAAPEPAGKPDPTDAGFVLGYAVAVLERELEVPDADVWLEGRVLVVRSGPLDARQRDVLTRALAIEGVEQVRFVERDGGALPDVAATASPRGVHRVGGEVPMASTAAPAWHLFPEEELFAPLIADPRWPHFSAAYQRYLADDELRDATAVSFGETIPLAGGPVPGGRAELALHAGVFSVFDLDSQSFDLINSDFLVGLAGTWRIDRLALMARLYHQSSHLGDELLLRDPIDRVNLSYEALELLASWDMPSEGLPMDVRLYGGGSYLVHHDPSDLEPWGAQLGLELRGAQTWLEGALRPLAAVDLQTREENSWDLDVSARAGVELERPTVVGQRLQLLLEYYDGHSPNGQFFRRDIEYLGVGAHLHF